MGHKVHPKAYRIKDINGWDSRGYYKEAAKYLEEDFKIRQYLYKKIGTLGVERIEIERSPGKVNVIILSAKPGLIIGRGGEGVERLKVELVDAIKGIDHASIYNSFVKHFKKNKSIEEQVETKTEKTELRIEIREVKNYWTSATLVGQWIAQQIEKRMPFRKILKQSIAKVVANKDVKGVRVEVSGRLNGNEIARREWLASGRLPRQTLRADIDYALVEAHCSYGVIGIKVWIYKGDKFE